MPTPNAYAMFATGCAMSAATAFRMGAGCLQVACERGPNLMALGLESQMGNADAARVEGELRDELIAMAEESSKVVIEELQRGLLDLDLFTRPEDGPAERPKRPYKVKR